MGLELRDADRLERVIDVPLRALPERAWLSADGALALVHVGFPIGIGDPTPLQVFATATGKAIPCAPPLVGEIVGAGGDGGLTILDASGAPARVRLDRNADGVTVTSLASREFPAVAARLARHPRTSVLEESGALLVANGLSTSVGVSFGNLTWFDARGNLRARRELRSAPIEVRLSPAGDAVLLLTVALRGEPFGRTEVLDRELETTHTIARSWSCGGWWTSSRLLLASGPRSELAILCPGERDPRATLALPSRPLDVACCERGGVGLVRLADRVLVVEWTGAQ